MSSTTRVWQAYTDALQALVSYPGSLQERLGRAMQQLATLGDQEVPAELLKRHQALKQAMKAAQPVGDEGIFVATARSLNDTQAAERANEIIKIYTRIVEIRAKK
jgi:hypothetical protein